MIPVGSKKPEVRAIEEQYARRRDLGLYSMLRSEVYLSTQEWQREMLKLFSGICGFSDAQLRGIKLVDVGCGYGGHLLDFLRIGLLPENLIGIDLLSDRITRARTRLPSNLSLVSGDAGGTDIADSSQDVVFQSVVFSSILDDKFQIELAKRMWRWLKPGGGVLWYDFVYNNPQNADVRGVPLRRIRQLFPDSDITSRKVTLAPPISRRVCRVHPAAYHVFNSIPLLRSHLLCWIGKRN